VNADGVPEIHLLRTTLSGIQIRGFCAPADDLVGSWHQLHAEHPSTG
jgi:hypothetical protein